MVRKLLVRSGAHFSGLLLVKLFSTALFIFFARVLEPEIFGKFSYFMIVISLLTLIFDWGLIQWFQVHWSKDKEQELICKSAQARLVTLLVAMVIFAVYVSMFRVFSFLELTIGLLLLIPEALTSIVDAYYLVHKQPIYIALKQLSKYFAPFLLLLFFAHSLTLFQIYASFLLSSLFTLFWYIPSQYYTLRRCSFHELQKVLSESSAYASLIVTSAVYSRGDAMILESKLGHSALGLYSAAYRYLDAVSLLPNTIGQNLFHLSAQSGSMTRRQIGMLTLLMGITGVVTAGVLWVLSALLTKGLLGDAYASSQEIVKVFSLVTIVLFVNSPLSTIVQSSRLIKQFLPWGIANTVVNLGLNVLIVPIAGGIGAAWVMLGTECTGLLINLYFVHLKLRQT